MRIVVTSDTHKSTGNFLDIIERHRDNADLFVNLGDSENEIETLHLLYPEVRIECVAGNCDWGSTLPDEKLLRFAGKKVFITHGHRYYVKHGYQRLQEQAKREGADICLFGHTHLPYTEHLDGIYYMNPGAVRDGMYGIVDIEKNGVMVYYTRI